MKLFLILNLIVIEILLVILHLTVYQAADVAFGIGSTALQWIFIALAFTFFAATLLGRKFQGRAIDWFYRASAYWFGLVQFLFGGAVVFYLAARVLYAYNIYVSPALLAGIPFAAFFLLHLYGSWTARRAEITRVNITLPGLPDAWKGKRIVFVSDLHLGNIYKEKFAAKVGRKINALAPEMICIGGDLYDGPACDVVSIIEPLRALHAPRGVYYITGNHEFYLPDVEKALSAVRGIGMRILHNEKVEIDGLTLAGVDHATTHKKEGFEAALANMKLGSGPSILLRHEPNCLEIAEKAGVSLLLAGHTHQGQVYPLNYITRTTYHGYDYGLKSLGRMQVFTSSGVGTWGPPLRLGTKSEIVLIELS